jgi:hypothetical protein
VSQQPPGHDAVVSGAVVIVVGVVVVVVGVVVVVVGVAIVVVGVVVVVVGVAIVVVGVVGLADVEAVVLRLCVVVCDFVVRCVFVDDNGNGVVISVERNFKLYIK